MSNYKTTAFVTPCSYVPKLIPRQFTDQMGRVMQTQTEQARYVAYLGGDKADEVANKIGVHKSFRMDSGIWLLTSNLRKKAIRLGVEKLPAPLTDENKEEMDKSDEEQS